MKHLFILPILLVIIIGQSFSQDITKYKKYTNKTYRFSFDIPAEWAIKYKDTVDGVICVPLTRAGKALYADCFCEEELKRVEKHFT